MMPNRQSKTIILSVKKYASLLTLLVALCAGDSIAGNISEYHSAHASNPMNFKMSIIDAHASGAYGLIGQDITHNGYTDLVSFAYSGTMAGKIPGEIYWYEFNEVNSKTNEYQWKKHLITKKKHVVQGAFMDVDNSGHEDLVFMSDFEVPVKDKNKEGNIWWAKRPINLNDPEWKTYWIGRSPGAHRITTADVNGKGSKSVIVVPLFSAGNPPMYGPASITLYVPSANPKLPWNKTVFVSPKFHAMHDAIVVPKMNGEKGENIVVAAQEGILMFSFYQNKENKWQMNTTILHSSPADAPADLTARDKGVEVLRLQQNADWNLSGVTALSKFDKKNPFIAAIDYTNRSGFLADQPWHGDTVSIYLPKHGSNLFAKNNLARTVLEKRSAGGHSVQIADFSGKGCPDVVAGFRAYPTALVLYQCKKDKKNNGEFEFHFEKQLISERSANAIVIGNWNKNGLPDIATVGYGNEGDPYILIWSNQNKP